MIGEEKEELGLKDWEKPAIFGVRRNDEKNDKAWKKKEIMWFICGR